MIGVAWQRSESTSWAERCNQLLTKLVEKGDPMSVSLDRSGPQAISKPVEAFAGLPGGVPMLAPANAWRILCTRTGGAISRASFYRWLSSGRLYSIRVGARIYIPWPELDRAIKLCLAGERL